MFKGNRNLFIIALIAVVNALGYGIIIPILYSYSVRFGLSDFQNGLLFATFAVCQFLATPIIGRLSDKYGRRPLLIISIAGTALSFFMAAFAPSAIFLFFARALDGITAGNIPVASAVISDTTEEKDRAKGFGIIGASFGVGFVVGPAISAVTVGISPSLPFIIAGIISIIAVVITAVFLPETNMHIGEVKKGRLFDFGKLYHALFDPSVGMTLLISLLYFLAFSCAILYGFQPFTKKILLLHESQIALLFVLFGIIGVIMQVFVVAKVTKRFGLKHTFSYALLGVAAMFLAMYFTRSLWVFAILSVFLGIASSLVQPLIQTILSNETDAKSQGTMMGINASYMSIGQIFGPILGGLVASYAVPNPFLIGSIFALLCFYLSFKVLRPGIKKESAF
jgi:MFS family permease